MKKEKYKYQQPPQWQDFCNYKTFERQSTHYLGYLQSYIDWFERKSSICRFLMKQGLFIAMYAGSLLCIYKIEGNYKSVELWTLNALAILVLSISLLPDLVTGKSVFERKENLSVLAIYFALPLLKVFNLNWEVGVFPLLGIGLGMSIIFYMVNRLEGYTRAWSRYRTAHYKVTLICCQKRTGLLTEKQSFHRLHHVIVSEVESRHKEIISDLHFFGNKVNGLLGKRSGL